jgi:hypothetical protein
MNPSSVLCIAREKVNFILRHAPSTNSRNRRRCDAEEDVRAKFQPEIRALRTHK